MRRVIVAAVACTPLACGFLESPTPNVDVSGTWALRSISGATLTDEPATIGGTYSVKGSALTLTEFSEPGPPPHHGDADGVCQPRHAHDLAG
jgi:hypothetical protein